MQWVYHYFHELNIYRVKRNIIFQSKYLKVYNFCPQVETLLFEKYIDNSLFQNFYFIYSYIYIYIYIYIYKFSKTQGRYSISSSSKTENGLKIVCWSQLGDIYKQPDINFLVIQSSITLLPRVATKTNSKYVGEMYIL